MLDANFNELVEKVLAKDSRYAPGAYQFVRKALNFTSKRAQLERPDQDDPHVQVDELLIGIRDYAHDQYGPMASFLLRHWGINGSEDFGNIVFNLIEHEIFSKNSHDSIEAFKDSFNFHDAFEKPYIPQSANTSRPRKRKKVATGNPSDMTS